MKQKLQILNELKIWLWHCILSEGENWQIYIQSEIQL